MRSRRFDISLLLRLRCNSATKSTATLHLNCVADQVAWLEALGDYLPRKPTVVITKDPEYGGNFVDVEFHDLSAPGPAAILLHGTTGADMHCSSIDEHERNVLKGLRQGHLLIGINGKDVAPDSMEDCLKKLTTIQRPLLMKFYEPADIEAIFTTDAETGLYFKGSSGRNFSIDTIESDSGRRSVVNCAWSSAENLQRERCFHAFGRAAVKHDQNARAAADNGVRCTCLLGHLEEDL